MNFKFQLVISDIDNRHLADYLIKEATRLCDVDVKTSYNNREIVISNVDSNTMVDDEDTTLVKHLSDIVDRYNKWKTESHPNVMKEFRTFLDKGGIVGKHTDIDEDTQFFTDGKGLLYIVDYVFKINNVAVCTCTETGLMHYYNLKVD